MFTLLPIVLFEEQETKVFCDVQLELVPETSFKVVGEVQWRYININHIQSITVTEYKFTDITMMDHTIQTVDMRVEEVISQLAIMGACAELGETSLAKLKTIPSILSGESEIE